MTVVIELRRHVDNDGDVLSDDGLAAARELGRHLAATAYDLAVSSGAQRATQTVANILALNGGTVPGGVIVEAGLRSENEDRWRAAYAEVGSGHLDDLRSASPEFVAAEVAALGAALARVAGLLAEGQRALVIGHSPTNEAAVLGLTGTTVAPLGTGEGVVLAGAGDRWDVSPASVP